MSVRTAVTFTTGWTGHVRLQNLSQATADENGWPRPYAPALSCTCGFGFALAYVGGATLDYLKARAAWLEYWGITLSMHTPGVAAKLVWNVLGPAISPARIMFWGWHSADGGATWTFYGPVGCANPGDDAFEFDFTLSWPEHHLIAEGYSLTPAHRERQAFTDDGIRYLGWQAPDLDHDKMTLELKNASPAVFTDYTAQSYSYSSGIIPDMYVALSLGGYVAAPDEAASGESLQNTVYHQVELTPVGYDLTDLDKLNSVTEDGVTWTNYTDGSYPASSDYLVDTAGGKFQWKRIGDIITGGSGEREIAVWDGTIYPPYLLRFRWTPRNFDDSETRTVPPEGASWEDWLAEYAALAPEETGAQPTVGPRLDIGLKNGDGTTPLYLDPGLSDLYTLPRYSWYDPSALWLPSRALTASLVESDVNTTDENPEVERANNPNDPEGAATTYHDRRCRLWAWPVNEDDYTQPPWWNAEDGAVLLLEHAASVDVNDPAGVTPRPSAWVAVSGASVDAGNNDLWTLTAANATLQRDYTTRYYAQMDCLAAKHPAGWPAEPSWPIRLKANLEQVDVSGADAETQALLTADEDCTHWHTFSYLRVKLLGDYNGRFQVRVTYSLVDYEDPHYTSYNHRYGEEGEFTWTRTPDQVATYSNDRDGNILTLTADTRQFDIDLCCPEEGGVPLLAWVDRVEFIFLDAPTSEQTVELDTLALVLSDRKDEDHHFLVGFKPSWDFYRRNYFGLGWVVDGLGQPQWDWYGDGRYENEAGLCYIEHIEHDPDFAGPWNDLSTVKPLSQLATELAYQEGITATYTAEALDALNKDGDGNALGSTAWYWVRRHADREMTATQQLELGIACGTLDIDHARGVPMLIEIEKNLGGKAHGIAKRGGIRARETGKVAVYWQETATGAEVPWTLLGRVTPDIHGRYRSDPCREDGRTGHEHDRSREYRVSRGAELGAAVNRSYWWEGAAVQGGGGLVSMYTDPTGVEWCAWVQGTNVYLARKENAPHTWGTAQVIDSSGDYDSASVTGDGRKISVACHKISDDKVYEFLCDSTGAKTSGPFLIGN